MKNKETDAEHSACNSVVSRIMKAVSMSFANADIEYAMRNGQAFVRVGGVPMGWIPGEMLHDPHPEQMGDVIRDYLIEKAMSG